MGRRRTDDDMDGTRPIGELLDINRYTRAPSPQPAPKTASTATITATAPRGKRKPSETAWKRIQRAMQPPISFSFVVPFDDGTTVRVPVTRHVEMQRVPGDGWTFVRTVGLKPSLTDTKMDEHVRSDFRDFYDRLKDDGLETAAAIVGSRRQVGNVHRAHPKEARDYADRLVRDLVMAKLAEGMEPLPDLEMARIVREAMLRNPSALIRSKAYAVRTLANKIIPPIVKACRVEVKRHPTLHTG